MKTFGDLRQRTARVPARTWAFAAAWLVGLAILESAGRRFSSDVADGAALLTLGMAVLVSAVLHQGFQARVFLPLLAKAVAGWKRLGRWSIAWGVDFAGTPPIPRGFPVTWSCLGGSLVVAGLALQRIAAHVPGGARDHLATTCYLGYLVALGALWSALSLGLLFQGFLGWGCLHDWLIERHRGPRPRSIKAEVRGTLAIVGATLLAAALLPPFCALWFQIFTLAAVSGALAVAGPGFQCVWKYRWGGPIRSVDGRRLVWFHHVVLVLINVDLVLLTCGDSMEMGALAARGGSMPVTALLGRLAAWFAVVGSTVVIAGSGRMLRLGLHFRPVPMRVPPLASAAAPEQSPKALRRAEIQCRRQIIRRMATLFRYVARRRSKSGTGLWIGLQHWFVLGLAPDETGDYDSESTVISEIVGPPFYRHFSPEARRHYWLLTRALRIDLIFVENGVSYRRLVRVFRMMFEIYDIFGGRQRAEEWHFTGLVGLRVVIHDFDLGAPQHGRQNYPEPDYDELGRARILMVFKDRGEAFVDDPIPRSSEGAPVTAPDGAPRERVPVEA